MRVGIIGNGVAAKSMVLNLQHSLRTAAESAKDALMMKDIQIILFDGVKNDMQAAVSRYYTGLWNLGFQNLSTVAGGMKSEYFRHIKESGYRSWDGKWLMKPGRGMQEPPCTPSLTFVRNDLLHQLLDSKISEVDMCRSSTARIDIDSKSLLESVLIYNDENDVQMDVGLDILIVADGCFSSLRSPLLNLHHNNIQHSVTDQDIITHRGYRVYRGFINLNHEFEKQDIQNMTSYQSWGPGARFAVVPTVDGIAWFIAVSSKSLPVTQECNNVAKSIDGTDDYNLLIKLARQHNGDKSILNTILNTIEDRIIVNEAWAFRRPQPLLLSGFSLQNKERGPLILFAGDAAHTLDPILAQGTGIAFEDAQHISHEIIQYLQHPELGFNFQRLQKTRMQRRRKLHYISNLAQSLGHIDSPLLNKVRDGVLSSVPQMVKGPLFDHFINLAAR